MIEFGDKTTFKLTKDEAWLYCLTLEHNGHKDWRMPRRSDNYNRGAGTNDFWYDEKNFEPYFSDDTDRWWYAFPVRDNDTD